MVTKKASIYAASRVSQLPNNFIPRKDNSLNI